MRHPFRKKTATSAALMARVERIAPIIRAAAVDALHNSTPGLANLVSSPELYQAFDQIKSLPDAELAHFLNMLEAGMPQKYRKQWEKSPSST